VGTGQRLRGKNALVFGAAGSIGSVVAKEMAAEGAHVYISGRSRPRLDAVAECIAAVGGDARVAVVDAEDAGAVDAYVDGVAKEAGTIDVVFNAMGPRVAAYGNGKPAMQLTVDEFMLPLATLIKSQFITSRAAARHMVVQRSGAIILVTGSPARPHGPGTTGIGTAFGAIENFTRSLAQEVSPQGVRVVCVRTAAMPETRTIRETAELLSAAMHVSEEQVLGRLANMTLLKVSPSIADTARAAVFAASDDARMMTGTVLNVSAGAVD